MESATAVEAARWQNTHHILFKIDIFKANDLFWFEYSVLVFTIWTANSKQDKNAMQSNMANTGEKACKVEACNMILYPHPLRQSKFKESRDQPRPGSLPQRRA